MQAAEHRIKIDADSDAALHTDIPGRKEDAVNLCTAQGCSFCGLSARAGASPLASFDSRVQGKAVGGGVGLASSVDYCYATKHAAVKLSELAVGIGPFVVGPAVERKLGLAGMSDLAINATEWRSAEWALHRGLYNDIFEDAAAMDEAIEALAGRLLTKSVPAMRGLKKVFWEGTEHWDELLAERAAISGELILSKEAKDAIGAFKSK